MGTITNDKGRLSQEDIDRMVKEAEKFKDKISEEDKKKIIDACKEKMDWLDANQTAEKDEFEHQKTELEGICNPIMTKLYQGAGVPPTDGQTGAPPPNTGNTAPTVEEVD